MELVLYFGGWVEGPNKLTDRTDGGWVQSTFGAKAEQIKLEALCAAKHITLKYNFIKCLNFASVFAITSFARLRCYKQVAVQGLAVRFLPKNIGQLDILYRTFHDKNSSFYQICLDTHLNTPLELELFTFKFGLFVSSGI